MIPVSKPHTPNKKQLYNLIDGAFSRSYLTNYGPLEQQLTETLATYFGVNKVVLVSSATFGLEMALATVTAENQSKKIYTTPFSFAATSTAIRRNGNPVSYIDIKAGELIPDYTEIELEDKVIIDTHVFGIPSILKRNSKKKGQKNIFDAAHSFDVFENGKHITSCEDISIISFHSTKLYHTIEGGAVISTNSDLIDEVKCRSNFGLQQQDIKISGNGKLSELHAAVGLVNFSELNLILEARMELKCLYDKEILAIGSHYLEIVATPSVSYYPIKFPNRSSAKKFIQGMFERGVQVKPYFNESLNLKYSTQNCPNSEQLAGTIICLPMSSQFSKYEKIKIIGAIQDTLNVIN